MKYEITQDQYVAFLNVLDSAQAVGPSASAAIDIGNTLTVRSGITGWRSDHPLKPGEYTTTNPYVPANTSFDNLSAYLDWAALRPMTELEYEKACRGPVTPVHNEFAWGTPYLVGYDPTSGTTTTVFYRLSNTGAANELVDTNYSVSAGNATWFFATLRSPNYFITRAGAFAASPSSTGRETAGATYYGIMEMTGNMAEQLITMGYPEGRAFTGRSGDGRLAADGRTDEGWPNITVTYRGTGYKGGFYNTQSPNALMVSDRSTAGDNFKFFGGKAGAGGRGVRLAP
jgi:formylglycine-generating enzyme required for sulfatase activity